MLPGLSRSKDISTVSNCVWIKTSMFIWLYAHNVCIYNYTCVTQNK